MLFCISNNPAIDRTLVVPGFAPGKVLRAAEEYVSAGGKGLNAARAAHALGHAVLCMGLVGGHHGRLLADLLAAEQLPAAFTWLERGETRTCTLVLDGAGGEPTVLNTAGPQVSPADWERLASDLLGRVRGGSAAQQSCAALFSGSFPPGAPLERFGALLGGLRQAEALAWVDTSRDALRAALAARPYGIKVNGQEIGAALGAPVESLDQALAAAQAVRQRGVQAACITLGAAGALLVTAGGAWRAAAPRVAAVSNVGSGDAFLGGLASAWVEGRPPEEALARGVAAGAANTLNPIPGRLDHRDFERILADVAVERLGA